MGQHEFKSGDAFRVNLEGGSYGVINSVGADGFANVTYTYGTSVKGEPITETGFIQTSKIAPIEQCFYERYISFRAWSAAQKEFEANPTYTEEQPQRRRYRAGRSVLQDWTNELSFMMQSVLICATRGPDGIRKDHPVKVIIRYLRRSFLICAFDGKIRWSPYEAGGGSFTGPLNLHGTNEGEGHLDKYVGIYLRHVDELPHHFQLHLMHAAEILGYKHPDSDVRGFWRTFYRAIVSDAHLMAESEETMERRLGDVEAQWREAEVVTAL